MTEVILLLALCVLLFWELHPEEDSRGLNHFSFIPQFELDGECHVGKYLTSLSKLQMDNSLGRLSHYLVSVITACCESCNPNGKTNLPQQLLEYRQEIDVCIDALL